MGADRCTYKNNKFSAIFDILLLWSKQRATLTKTMLLWSRTAYKSTI